VEKLLTKTFFRQTLHFLVVVMVAFLLLLGFAKYAQVTGMSAPAFISGAFTHVE